MMHLTPASHPSTAAFVTESKFKWLEFQWLERTWSQQGRQKTQFFNSEPKPRQSAFVLGSLARSFQVIPTLICWAAMKTKTKQKKTHWEVNWGGDKRPDFSQTTGIFLNVFSVLGLCTVTCTRGTPPAIPNLTARDGGSHTLLNGQFRSGSMNSNKKAQN